MAVKRYLHYCLCCDLLWYLWTETRKNKAGLQTSQRKNASPSPRAKQQCHYSSRTRKKQGITLDHTGSRPECAGKVHQSVLQTYIRNQELQHNQLTVGNGVMRWGINSTCSVRMSWPAMEALPWVGETSPDRMPSVVLFPGIRNPNIRTSKTSNTSNKNIPWRHLSTMKNKPFIAREAH